LTILKGLRYEYRKKNDFKGVFAMKKRKIFSYDRRSSSFQKWADDIGADIYGENAKNLIMQVVH